MAGFLISRFWCKIYDTLKCGKKPKKFSLTWQKAQKFCGKKCGKKPNVAKSPKIFP
jgi:hypothetical protein